jgi:hypothetical protein
LELTSAFYEVGSSICIHISNGKSKLGVGSKVVKLNRTSWNIELLSIKISGFSMEFSLDQDTTSISSKRILFSIE